MNFPKIGPAHAPEIEIKKKYWMSFPEIRLCHTPQKEKMPFETPIVTEELTVGVKGAPRRSKSFNS